MKKDEIPTVTPFRKYTLDSKIDKQSIGKTISSKNIKPKTTITNKSNSDKVIEDELQRLVNVNIKTLVSTINEKVQNEYEIYNRKVEDFLSKLFEDKINKIREITKSYESDIRRLEPILDAYNENNINNIVYKQVKTDMAQDINELESEIQINKSEGLDKLKIELDTNLHNISISQYIDRSSFQVLNTIKTTLANCNINEKGDIKSTKQKRNNK